MSFPEGLHPGAENQEIQGPNRLILPRSLDLDLKRTLSPDGIAEFVDAVDPAAIDPELLDWHKQHLAQRVASRWSMMEAIYLLYGRETPNALVCNGFYFQYYNLFHYLDMSNPQEAAREDICPDDRELGAHTHSFLWNPNKNPNRGRKLLGYLHNHNRGLIAQKRMTTVGSVGFSAPDWDNNNRYLQKYGTDGRNMAFVIYYPGDDFYKGITVSQTSQPGHLEIEVV